MAIKRISRQGIRGINQRNLYGLNPIVSATVNPFEVGGYRVWSYTTAPGSGTFAVTANNPIPNVAYSFEYLVVAGGGSGGFDFAGGGGAGGLRTGTVNFTGTSQTVTVGGAAGPSAFGTVASCTRGGGGGPWNSNPGGPGGSGGGGAGAGPGTGGGGGGAGIAGEGNPGSPGSWNPGPYAGGGGGAGAPGGTFGSPGAGLSNSITGTAVTYAQGGSGQGGGTTGAANTGGGGRGGAPGMGSGSPGGTGIVVVRYSLA